MTKQQLIGIIKQYIDTCGEIADSRTFNGDKSLQIRTTNGECYNICVAPVDKGSKAIITKRRRTKLDK